MKTSTRWILGGALVVAATVVWAVVGDSGITVEVAEARRDTLAETVQEEGRTRARELFVVAAPVTGRLSRPEVEDGDRVERAEVLATLAPAPDDPRVQAALRAQVTAAEARIERARAEEAEAGNHLAQARREAERRRPLYDMGALSRETMERYEETAEQAEVRRAAARAALDAARAELDRARAQLLGSAVEGEVDGGVAVRAPVGGTVLRVLEESERVVTAGTPLFEMADPGGLQIEVDVLTEEAVRVAPGNPMRVEGWGGRETLHGRVLYVEPAAFTEVSTLGVEEQRVNVVGALEHPPSGLGVGYRADVSIVVWRGDDVLSVPASALFRREGRWHLFAVADGRAELRAVEVGREGVGRVEIVDGLEVGTPVILYPSDGVEDGVRVRVGGG